MADHHEGTGRGGEPVPRDLPDQQAGRGEDPWEPDEEDRPDEGPEDDVPDTDEAGTGRRGAPHSATTVNPEHPIPDEPSA